MLNYGRGKHNECTQKIGWDVAFFKALERQLSDSLGGRGRREYRVVGMS
jgi:hypothetical protein